MLASVCSYLSSPYYFMLSHLVSDAKWRRRHQYQMVIPLLMLTRFITLAVLRCSLHDHSLLTLYCELDPAAHFLVHSTTFVHTVPSLIVSCFLIIWAVFTIFTQFYVFFSPVDTPTWLEIYAMGIYNTHLYQSHVIKNLDPKKKQKMKLYSMISIFYRGCFESAFRNQSLLQWLHSLVGYDEIDEPRRDYWLDTKQRVLVLFSLSFSENVFTLLHFVVAFLTTMSASLYFSYFSRIGWLYQWWHCPQVVLIFVLDAYAFFMFVRNALVYCSTSILLEASFQYCLIHLKNALGQVWKRCAIGRRLRTRDRVQLIRFMERYVSMCHYVLYAGGQLWTSVIYTGLLCNIPINILLLYFIFYYQQNTTELAVFTTVLVFQALILLIVFVPLAFLNSCFNATRPMWPRIIFGLSHQRKRFLLLLKCSFLYERINTSNNRYGLSMGGDATITKQKFFEIMLFYIAYVLITFKFCSQNSDN